MRTARASLHWILWAALLLALQGCGRERARSDREFEQTILDLSEEPGYFDTDNLISNEPSYLEVLPRLSQLVPAGRAYLGVGPGQNFSYIWHTRAALALLVDVRRGNLLEHLYFKSWFESSANRWEYLAGVLGRRLPTGFRPPGGAGIEPLVSLFEDLPPEALGWRAGFERHFRELRARFPRLVLERDRPKLERIARAFFREGLELKFHSSGRPPRPFYPTLGQLLRARDASGRQSNFLASETSFTFLKKMQRENRIIPLVGDLAGKKTVAGAAHWIQAQGLRLGAFYVSNVEFYLLREGRFEPWLENLSRLPIDSRSVLIRSYFQYGPGRPVLSLLQGAERFLRQETERPARSYRELALRDSIR